MVPLKVRAEGQADADPPVKRLRGPDRKLSPQAQRLGRCTMSKGWSGKPKRVHAVLLLCKTRHDTETEPFRSNEAEGNISSSSSAPHRTLSSVLHVVGARLRLLTWLGHPLCAVAEAKLENGTALVFPPGGGSIEVGVNFFFLLVWGGFVCWGMWFVLVGS
jgi:hypothetical protein